MFYGLTETSKTSKNGSSIVFLTFVRPEKTTRDSKQPANFKSVHSSWLSKVFLSTYCSKYLLKLQGYPPVRNRQDVYPLCKKYLTQTKRLSRDTVGRPGRPIFLRKTLNKATLNSEEAGIDYR